ncbi:hypothetical protein DXA97_05175 [Clostridium sp. OF09-36]|nr:hypothetical protein DXA97_05175 [Clostridium sp. OF09-36]
MLEETEQKAEDPFTPEEADALRKLVRNSGERPDCAKCAKPLEIEHRKKKHQQRKLLCGG